MQLGVRFDTRSETLIAHSPTLAWQSFLTMPNFALLSTPGALLRKVPPLLRITFVCPLQSGFSFCSPFFRNSACSNLDDSHGRRPAMRVSERVRPTADLAPLTIQAAGQWAEASHEGLRRGPPQLTSHR